MVRHISSRVRLSLSALLFLSGEYGDVSSCRITSEYNHSLNQWERNSFALYVLNLFTFEWACIEISNIFTLPQRWVSSSEIISLIAVPASLRVLRNRTKDTALDSSYRAVNYFLFPKEEWFTGPTISSWTRSRIPVAFRDSSLPRGLYFLPDLLPEQSVHIALLSTEKFTN